MMNKSVTGVIISTALLSSSAIAGQWSLGAITSYSPAVYKDTDSNQVVIPLIGYEGEHVFLRGFSAGARLFPAGTPQNIIFRVRYDPRTLKPSDSDNLQIQQLDERESSVLAGVSYQQITPVGVFEIGAGTDIGDQHNGLYAEAAWRLPIRANRWGVTPEIGLAYNSDKINNHLYGVSEAESVRSGLAEFDAGWDGQYFIGMNGHFMLSQHIRFTAGIRYSNLEGDIASSPILERSVSHSGSVGIAYIF